MYKIIYLSDGKALCEMRDPVPGELYCWRLGDRWIIDVRFGTVPITEFTNRSRAVIIMFLR